MTDISTFIYQFEGEQRRTLEELHQLLEQTYGLTCKIRYKIPFYYRKSWICYLNPLKNNGIELAFTRGNELSNAQGLLTNKGRKQVFGLELERVSDIPFPSLGEVIQEAILLDETVPYASKRNKGRI